MNFTEFQIHKTDVANTVITVLECSLSLHACSVPGVVACTFNPATLKAEYWNGVVTIPVGGNSPSIGGEVL